MGKSGDLRKRNAPKPQAMFWQPFRHMCGCYLAWGLEVPQEVVRGSAVAFLAQERVIGFLRDIKDYPCPMCGSTTGVPSPPLQTGERRYMPGSNAWYRALDDDQEVYADRLAGHLGGQR